MALIPRQYAKILYELTHTLDEKQLDQAMAAFVQVLKKDQAVSLKEKIIHEFEQYAKKQAGTQQITITTARPINKVFLQKVADVFGDNVQTRATVDPAILGGLIIRTEDKILDGSIATQLLKMKTSLL